MKLKNNFGTVMGLVLMCVAGSVVALAEFVKFFGTIGFLYGLIAIGAVAMLAGSFMDDD